MASMSNTKDISVLVRKMSLALTFTGSNEAQFSVGGIFETVPEKGERNVSQQYLFWESCGKLIPNIPSGYLILCKCRN